ncbi:MAG: preprotein translocase subunit SecG [Chitinivibrionales bacterium]|nr:preprotein translocase subunit SecG [Chitinivibrionales bacterium]
MWFGLIMVVYVAVCIILCLLVLIQSDKGGGISGAIGGGLSGANQLLGTRDTANILTRGTTGFAIAFMVLCIVISLFLSKLAPTQGSESLLKQRAEQGESFAPSSILDGEGGIVPVTPPGESSGEVEPAPVEPVTPAPSDQENE